MVSLLVPDADPNDPWYVSSFGGVSSSARLAHTQWVKLAGRTAICRLRSIVGVVSRVTAVDIVPGSFAR